MLFENAGRRDSALDADWRRRGFLFIGHDEISQWQAARTHRLQLKAAGFSDQEIDAYLARAPEGPCGGALIDGGRDGD
jgi:hypothetical protein